MFNRLQDNIKSKKMPILIICIILLYMFFYSFFNNLNFEKAITVNGHEAIKVIPGGGITGVKLYVEGVLVVGKSDVLGLDNNIYKPINKTNIKEGDRIISANDTTINNSNDLIKYLENFKGEELIFKYVRNGQIYEDKINPVYSKEDNMYRLGIWVKDGGIGIGTITFYREKDNGFAAIGHGISDIDTGKLLESNNGKLVDTNIIEITKGKRNVPGEIKGIFNEKISKGIINKNTDKGIYGNYTDIEVMDKYKNGICICSKEEVEIGKATILCKIEEEIKEYEIEIEKKYENNDSNKNMIIKITDKDLLEKTGGIVQGMSGCPIIQNNKLVGAITHVLVSDPTRGYAVFGDLMIKEM